MSSENQDPVKTICPYCGVGCGIKVQPGDEPGDMQFRPWADAPVNEGRICIKGGAATEVVDHEDRLTDPLIKEDGEFRETTWEEAYGLIVSELERIREEHGPDGMGFFGSSKTMNEENYLIQKLARRYGTNQVDNCTRMCHASTVWALRTSLGMGAMTNSMADLEEAADVFWIQGANPGEQHPIANSQYFRQAVLEGATVIQVDPHANKTTQSFQIDETDRHMHLQLEPGTDIPLLNAVLKTVLERHEDNPDEGWIDEGFIEERTEGFEHLRETLEDFDKEAAAEECSVPLEDIELAAEKYAMANNAAIFTGMGMSQHTCGVDNVQNEINLSLVTGNVGRPGTGVNPLRGQNNVQGTCDVGAMPNVLPGYQLVDDEARESVEEVWGFEVPDEPGLTNVEISHAIGDSVHGLYVMGENPIMSEPDGNRTERRFREDLGFLVVQDIFMTETAEHADVILPAATSPEKHGTFTNTERRIQRVRPTADPAGKARQDWEITQELARRLGYEWGYDHPREVMDEISDLTPIYGGVSYDRLEGGEEHGLQWPCWDEDHPGTPYLYDYEEGNFNHDDGLARFVPADGGHPSELPDEEYPLTLTSGRVLYHWHTGQITRRVEGLMSHVGESFVELHPDTAEQLGIAHDDYVRVESRRGAIVVRAEVTDRVGPGTLFIPMHFAAGAVNKLTQESFDPQAGIPEYKVSSVRIEPLGPDADASILAPDAPSGSTDSVADD